MAALPFAKVFPTVFAALFLLAVTLRTVFPGQDPYRCRAVLNTGRWIDPADWEGNRAPFNNWQPDGCILHKYSSPDVRRCIEGRRILFGGDSTSRGVSYGVGRLLERAESNYDRDHISPSIQFNVTYHGITLERYANVWLHGDNDEKQIPFMRYIRQFGDEKRNPPASIDKQQGAALFYVGAGVWYTNWDKERDGAGRLALFHENFANLSEALGPSGKNIFTDPMDPVDGVGNQLFFAPPAGPRYLGDSGKKIKEINRRRKDVYRMQDWLRENESKWNMPIAWAMAKTIEGQNMTWRDPYGTGFHVIDSVAEARANIMLNARCNAKLDRILPYPREHTCCTDYGIKPLVQQAVVAFFGVYLFACVFSSGLGHLTGSLEPRWATFDMKHGAFPLALLMAYFADRTQLMAKGSKQWQLMDFLILLIISIIVTGATVRKTRAAANKAGYQELSAAAIAPEDEPFLSREQTDEWKGWMQAIILIYHWTNATPAPVYTIVRVLVAAYLFQTGYGHTLFYLNKKDYSFQRVASTLIRLNLLSCSLAYVMDTDYMLYYFSPLVSFWYIVVYTTFAVRAEQYNHDIQLVIVKIFVSALLVSTVAMATPLMKWAFWVLKLVFQIQWSYQEWYYRLSLDMFIVYVGMLVAIASTQVKFTLQFGLRVALAAAGFMALVHYFVTSSKTDTTSYKLWHPYASAIPILAFIALRNVTGKVRNYHSTAMAWLGRCSLETYTLQFHLLLAADTRGVLLVDGLYGNGNLIGRLPSLLVIVPLFLWISNAAAIATGHLVKTIMHTPSNGAEKASTPSALGRVGAVLSSPHMRIGTLLAVMWLLNLMSPSHAVGDAPDGFTPYREEAYNAPAPGATPTPA